MACSTCNNINCTCASPAYGCGCACAPTPMPKPRQAPSPIRTSSCGCGCVNSEIPGTRRIADSHEINHGRQRAVFFVEGGCDVVDKGYIPSTQNLSSNGPKRKNICCNESGLHLESEGMDCLNFVFNQSKAGQSF